MADNSTIDLFSGILVGEKLKLGWEVGDSIGAMEAQSEKDRRSSPRIPVTVKCWLERESITLLGTITNISHGGIFFRTPVSVAEGSDVDLRVTVNKEVISVKGQVAWTAPEECKPGQLGLGIGFKKSADSMSLFRCILDAKEDKLR